MRLKHHVRDKFFAQSPNTGGVDAKTAQPTRGAARNGALRLGEMEFDALVAIGASYTIRERLLTQSDGTMTYFCRACGLPAMEVGSKSRDRRTVLRCQSCMSAAEKAGLPYVPDVASVYMGRSSMLVLLTFLAIGVAIRLRFEHAQ